MESSARLLPLRVEDPAGGPPWGLRIVRTSRKLTCVQVGRVVDGQLGVLGQDGVAGNDGRFHPLPVTPRAELRRARRRRQRLHEHLDGDRGQRPAATARHAASETPAASAAALSREDERRVLFGLLGPEATSITYRDHGRCASRRSPRPRART